MSRAKLYFLRDRTGKSARIAEKIKKKIGIDIVESKPEIIKEEIVKGLNEEKDKPKDTQPEMKKEVKNKDKKKEVKIETKKEILKEKK